MARVQTYSSSRPVPNSARRSAGSGGGGGRKTAAQLAAEQAAREATHAQALSDLRNTVDDWFAGDEPSLQLDLSDGSQAAVEAVKLRASELGIVASQLPGRRVVVQLARPSSPARRSPVDLTPPTL